MKLKALSTDVRNVLHEVRLGEQLMGRIFDVISALCGHHRYAWVGVISHRENSNGRRVYHHVTLWLGHERPAQFEGRPAARRRV